MASFTDAISQFNPYVQELPVELMMAVGMKRQAQYDAGVEKVQQYVNNVAGLDVTDKHKPYLTSKLNELGNNLKTFSSADFSNQQIVNTVGGMTTQLVKDPIIEAGVYSAQKIRKAYAEMDEAQKKNMLNPSNEFNFTKRLSSWMKNGDLKDKFTGEYTPYFDTNDFIKKEFDALKPDGFSFQEVFQTDAKGNIVRDKNGVPQYSKTMLEFQMKGIYPERVAATLDRLLSDPRVSKQLEIDGEYIYNAADGEMLRHSLASEKSKELANSLSELDLLGLRKMAGQNVDLQVAQVTDRIDRINGYYKSMEELAMADPESIKGTLYKNRVKNDYLSQYSQFERNKKELDNPGWQADFKLQQEAYKRLNDARELRFKYDQLSQQKELSGLDRASREYIAKLSLAGKLAGKDLDGDGVPDVDASGRELGQGREPSDLDVVFDNERKLTDAAEGLISNGDSFLAGTVLNTPQTSSAISRLMATGMTRQEATRQAIDNAAKQRKMDPVQFRASLGNAAINTYNRMDPVKRNQDNVLKDSYNSFIAARKNFANASASKQELDKIVGQTLTDDEFKNKQLLKFKTITGTYQGQKITVTPQDQYDLALYLNEYRTVLPTFSAASKKAARQAEERLKKSGKGFLLDAALRQNMVAAPEGITPLVRTLKDVIPGMMAAGFNKLVTGDTGLPNIDLRHLAKVVDKLEPDALESLAKRKSDVIKKFEGKPPVLESSLFSLDDKGNKEVFNNLKAIVTSSLEEPDAQLSPTAQSFARAIVASPDFEKVGGIEIKYTRGAGGVTNVELIRSSPASGEIDSYTLKEDDAKRLGISLDNVYETDDIRNLRTLMNYRGGKTSSGDPMDISAYYNSDVQYEMNDFPNLASSNMGNLGADVKANILEKNGKYYGVFYVKKPGQEVKIRNTSAANSIAEVQQKIFKMADPRLLNAIQ